MRDKEKQMERYWRILTGILNATMETWAQLICRFEVSSDLIKSTGRVTGGGSESSRRVTEAKQSGRQTDHTPQSNISSMQKFLAGSSLFGFGAQSFFSQLEPALCSPDDYEFKKKMIVKSARKIKLAQIQMNTFKVKIPQLPFLYYLSHNIQNKRIYVLILVAK